MISQKYPIILPTFACTLIFALRVHVNKSLMKNIITVQIRSWGCFSYVRETQFVMPYVLVKLACDTATSNYCIIGNN